MVESEESVAAIGAQGIPVNSISMSTSDLRTILREAKGKELGVVVRVAENILGEYELELRRQMQA